MQTDLTSQSTVASSVPCSSPPVTIPPSVTTAAPLCPLARGPVGGVVRGEGARKSSWDMLNAVGLGGGGGCRKGVGCRRDPPPLPL